MREKIYVHLLILCGIWSHGIIATFADKEIKESLDISVRHKRVVSYAPNEHSRITISEAKYVVIVRHNFRAYCTGSIISNRIVITAASCAQWSQNQYQIISSTTSSNRGQSYNVTEIRSHLSIALFTVDRPFRYDQFCGNVELHVAPLLTNTVGRVSGWGYNCRGPERGTDKPVHLRSIEVPIMSHQECVNRYRPHIAISEREVCTYHHQRHCGHTDFGAGLVVDGYLAGVYLWSGPIRSVNNPEYPDVFAVLQHSEYSQWLRSNMREIEVQFENRN